MSVNLFNGSTKRTNVLFVGGGRRNTLAKMFKARGFNVYAYEVDSQAPIRTEAVLIEGEVFDSPNFDSHLRKTVNDYSIDLVLPLQDKGIPLCSRIRQAICSPYDVSIYCSDKYLFEQFMLDNFRGTYPEVTDDVEIIKKPRFGYGSNDIEIVDEIDEEDTNYVYQAYRLGKEYTVDAYFDIEGRMVNASPRERIRVAGGEVVDSITVNHPELHNITQVVGECLGLIGPVCMQYIIEDGKPYLFEINARFGGGSTLSIHAGLDMIDMLKKEYVERKKLCASDYKVDDNMMVKRTFTDTYWKIT